MDRGKERWIINMNRGRIYVRIDGYIEMDRWIFRE